MSAYTSEPVYQGLGCVCFLQAGAQIFQLRVLGVSEGTIAIGRRLREFAGFAFDRSFRGKGPTWNDFTRAELLHGDPLSVAAMGAVFVCASLDRYQSVPGSGGKSLTQGGEWNATLVVSNWERKTGIFAYSGREVSNAGFLGLFRERSRSKRSWNAGGGDGMRWN